MFRRRIPCRLQSPWVVFLLCWAGCGGGGAEETDGAVAGDGAVEESLTPPGIPWLDVGSPPIVAPTLVPCPDGWREVVDDDGLAVCDPSAGGTPDCSLGTFQFPGDASCMPVGPACPADGRVADLPADRPVVHVREGAVGGDGSRSSPYGSLTEFAWGSLSSGTVVATDVGRYDGPVRLPAGIALRGACVEGTVLTRTAGTEGDVVVAVVGAAAEVRDLRIDAPVGGGVGLGAAGTSLRAQNVWVQGAHGGGVLVLNGSALEAEGLVVRDTEPYADATNGEGLVVQSSTARVTRAAFVSNRTFGVIVRDDSSEVELSDVVISHTRSRLASFESGFGLGMVGGILSVDRAVLTRNRKSALTVFGGSAELTDVVVRDTVSQELNRDLGSGIAAFMGADLTARRILIERNLAAGVLLEGGDVTGTFVDVVVRDTGANELDGDLGFGIAFNGGASGTVERAALLRNHSMGIAVDGGTVGISDVTIRDTRLRASDGLLGRGMGVASASDVTVDRALLEGNPENGVVVHEARLALADAAIRDQGPDATLSPALVAQRNAVVEASRVLAEEVSGVGFYFITGATVDLSDAVSRQMRLAGVEEHVVARSLNVAGGAHVTVARSVFADGQESGVAVGGSDTELALTDVVVEDTSAAPCVGGGACPSGGAGNGVASFDHSTTRMSRFRIQRSDLCGVFLLGDARLDLHDGEVRDNTIGACVQIDGYDVGRLQDSVSYRDNGTALQATSLPTPPALGGSTP